MNNINQYKQTLVGNGNVVHRSSGNINQKKQYVNSYLIGYKKINLIFNIETDIDLTI